MSGIVPVVDLSPWRTGGASERAAVAEAIDGACRSIGFLQVVGHGLAPDVVDGLLAATTAFFDRPMAEKLALRPPSAEVNRGYAAPGTEGLGYSLGLETPPDLFEAFNVGVDAAAFPDDPYYQAEATRTFAPNLWPGSPPGFREAVLAYVAAVRGVADTLTSIFAVALGLPEDWFVDKTNRSVDVLRCNNYERRAGDPDAAPGQMRMGAHTDYGICTVLLADPVPGLQIVGPDGAWHDVVPDPGALVVNLGDALAVWTNDRWRSTLHRVVPPPAQAAGPVRRRSYAFFHDGNYDAVLECLPTCCSADDPPRYPPITLQEHVLGKLLGPRTLTAAEQVSTVGGRESALRP